MIHSYKLNGYNIVLDVGSGSVHAVDELAFDVINLYETHTPDEIVAICLEKYASCEEISESEIRDTVCDVEELKNEGKLFSDDPYAPLVGKIKNNSNIVKALCLHIAHTCNLNCEYCFAAQGRYHGERALMSYEVGKRALDFLVENSGTRRNLEVDFFGGEPLMNWQVVKDLVAYARSIEEAAGKHFRFTLTTNGLLIDDDVIEFSNREMDNVVLSLDGRRHVHDNLRKTVNGAGSYDLILPKFKEFVRRRGDRGYYVRGTYTKYNTDFCSDILHMADEGFTELSMEPVVCAEGDPYALSDADLPILYEQYEKLAVEMLRRKREGRPITFYHYMIDLEGGPCIYKRISGCGSGTEYMAVTPWGDLYPCHQFVGDEKYKLGDLWQGVTNDAVRDEFRACSAYSRAECRECWARLYCSGGCAANSYHATGSVGGIYEYGCKLFKKRIECAIMLKVAEAMDADGE